MPFPIRTIEKLFNRDTHLTVTAGFSLDKFEDRDQYVLLRRSLRKRNKENNPYLVCDECGTALELSCTKNYEEEHTFYFKHIKDPGFDKCSIKTGQNITKEEIQRRQYAFKSESNAHISLKNKVGSIIQQYFFSDVIIDKKFILDRYGDSERRKPDIYFKFNEREITIEFQINNTFHTVIEERESFYERSRISLMWVFAEFDPYNFQSITVKDIFIPNGNNAFVFNLEAEQASHENKTLCFKVWYKKFYVDDFAIKFEWLNEIVSIDQIKYNPETFRPFYYDCSADKLLAEVELNEILTLRELERKKQNATVKANQIMDFLSDFRKNDLLNSVNQLVIIQQSSEIEKQILNDILKLNTYSNQGKNIIQVLLSKKAHYNLIIFLLKSKNIYLPLNTKLSDVETTFISCLKSSYFQDKIVQLLFSRGYHLCERDFEFIKQNYCQLEQKKMLFTFQNYEKLEQFSYIEKFYDHLNEFLVIESAKNGRLSILGNEKQSLLWMANLAAKEYSEHWMYFDFAFKHYGLYPALMNDDKKGTFRSKLKSLSDSSQEKDTRFESVLSVLYPELM